MVIDLWLEELSVTDDEYQYYWSLLGKNEQERALRFVQTKYRRDYVASHGKLRLILAKYLGTPPEKILFTIQSHGKPFVACDRSSGIRFNMAHSGDHMAVGISYANDIGVDIEVWTDRVDYCGIIAVCFSEEEIRFWLNLPNEQQQEFFFRLWTRKESFVKAVGLGLELEISRVETTLTGVSEFLSLPANCGMSGSWSLIDLELAHGLSGSITVHSRIAPRINYKSLL